MKKIHHVSLVFLLIAIIAIPRVLNLGSFVSLDEPFWLRAGINFYYALGQHDFENTIYEYHPAVTTLWVITAGMLTYFPEYRALEQGYLKKTKLELFFSEHNKDFLQLLVNSRIVQIIVITILLIIVYFLLRLLFNTRTAFFTTIFISISPYFFGHSRLLNHEAMLSLFLLVSLLSILVFVYKDQNILLLLLSSSAGALAQLTKSTGIVLFPLILLILIVYAFKSAEKKGWKDTITNVTKVLILWIAGLAFIYFLLWPGMWVAPGKMLTNVYGNALSYAFQGARLDVTQELNPSSFSLADVGKGVQKFATDIIRRTTPLSQLGFLFGIWAIASKKRHTGAKTDRLVILYSLILGISFILLFSILRGRDSPHYILTSYVCINLIAGLGWVYCFTRMEKSFSPGIKQWGVLFGLLLVVAIQAFSTLSFYPYYFTYYNPVIEAIKPNTEDPYFHPYSYGVGVEQAAAYLAQKENAADMTVMSVYGYGSFSFYFPGQTIVISDLIIDDLPPRNLEYLHKSDYVVIDYYYQKKQNTLGGLTEIKPEKIIWLHGIEYLHIYRTADILAYLDAKNTSEK